MIILVFMQCSDKNGNIGSFLKDQQGNQISKTYDSLYALIKSDEYKKYNNGNNLIKFPGE